MKNMRKFFALVLALVMVMSLATVAFAAGSGNPPTGSTITINNAKGGETYNLYKLFDLKVNDESDPTAYTYTVNENWADFFKAAAEGVEAGPGNQYVTINEAGAVTAISDAAALAKAAAEWTGKPASPTASATAEKDGAVTFENIEEHGYWLITSTLGTIAMTETTPDKEAVTINEKNPANTIEKEVKEDSTGEYGESNDAQVGDTVAFKSTVKIVKGTRNVVVHDKMDSGLTYTTGSVAIDGLAKGTDYTVNESPTDGDTFDITFTQSWIDGLDFGTAGNKEYVITYTATLNENAVVTDENGVAIVDQYNKTRVSFGDNTKSEEDTTKTETWRFVVHKYAEESEGVNKNLAGAVFSLKKDGTVVKLIKLDDENYRVANGDEEGAVETFITVATGDISIWGVDADTYSLEEIEAPAGYNKLTAEVEVKVLPARTVQYTYASIENQAGTELPSTGGMGTTLFYILGGLMVAGSAVLLITKKRMGAEG